MKDDMTNEYIWNINLKEVMESCDYNTGHDVLRVNGTIRWVISTVTDLAQSEETFGGMISGLHEELYKSLMNLVIQGVRNSVPTTVMIGLLEMVIFQNCMEMRLVKEAEQSKVELAATGPSTGGKLH